MAEISNMPGLLNYYPYSALQHLDLNNHEFRESLRALYEYIKFNYSYITITSTDSPYTIDLEHRLTVIDATSGNIVVNLPATTKYLGLNILFKRIDSSGNTVTLTPNGGDTIDGDSTVLMSQWDAFELFCNGNGVWYLEATQASIYHALNSGKFTVYDNGTKTTGTFTPEPSNSGMQEAVNGGAHTLAPPTETGAFLLYYTNNASAGTITTSGFGLILGDTLNTTNTNRFEMAITNDGTTSILQVTALQ